MVDMASAVGVMRAVVVGLGGQGCEGKGAALLQREQREQRLRVARLPRHEGRLRLRARGEEEGAG